MLFCFSFLTGIPAEFSPNPFYASEGFNSYFEFAKLNCSDHTLRFFITILVTRIPRLKKAEK